MTELLWWNSTTTSRGFVINPGPGSRSEDLKAINETISLEEMIFVSTSRNSGTGSWTIDPNKLPGLIELARARYGAGNSLLKEALEKARLTGKTVRVGPEIMEPDDEDGWIFTVPIVRPDGTQGFETWREY